MYWAKLRRGQLDELDRMTPVILPVAATEQHGAHLPLHTDCMILEAILERVNQAIGERTLILPMQQIGCSEHHMRFPGSLTLTHETFRRCVMELAESVARHGFRRIFILNSHGGNQGINAVLGDQIGQAFPNVECLVANWWNIAGPAVRDLQEGGLGSVGHACEFETSIILAVAPQLVDMSIAEDGGIQHRPPLVGDLLNRPPASCYRPFHVMTPNGVFGKPSLASAAKGEKILAATAKSIVDLVEQFWPRAEATSPPGR